MRVWLARVSEPCYIYVISIITCEMDRLEPKLVGYRVSLDTATHRVRLSLKLDEKSVAAAIAIYIHSKVDWLAERNKYNIYMSWRARLLTS
jgi:hypothetical protein